MRRDEALSCIKKNGGAPSSYAAFLNIHSAKIYSAAAALARALSRSCFMTSLLSAPR